MALIICPICGGKLSDKANICPHCEHTVGKKAVIKETNTPISSKSKAITDTDENDDSFYRKHSTYDLSSDLQDMRSHGIGCYRSDFQENFLRSKRHPHLDDDK